MTIYAVYRLIYYMSRSQLAPHTIIGRAGDVELAVFVFPGAGAYVLGGCLEQIGVKLTKRFIPNNRLTNSAELRTLAETAGRAVDTNSGAHLLGNKVLEVIGRTRPELRAKLEELVKL